ncbi:MAG: hypothetical protein KF780_03505 [Sphingomonas sp.]|nr:hypothetical protein [Sphingomonas sp.]
MSAVRQIGSGAFLLIAGGMLVYAGLGLVLIASADWPAACDAAFASGKMTKLIGIYRCSPGLLGVGAAEIATFLWLWLVPAGLALLFLTLGLRARAAGTRMQAE